MTSILYLTVTVSSRHGSHSKYFFDLSQPVGNVVTNTYTQSIERIEIIIINIIKVDKLNTNKLMIEYFFVCPCNILFKTVSFPNSLEILMDQ